MAVAGKRVERDVGEQADFRDFFLDRAQRAADEIVRVERFAASFVAQLRIGVGEEGKTGDGKFGGTFGFAHGLVDRQPLDIRHRRDRGARILSVHDEQRPDQVVGSDLVLAHHAARPLVAAVTAHAHGEVERRALRLDGLRIDRNEADLVLQRTAELDRHGSLQRRLFSASATHPLPE